MVAGWLLDRLASALRPLGDDAFAASRLAPIDYFLSAIVPEALGLAAAAGAGTELLYKVPAEALA